MTAPYQVPAEKGYFDLEIKRSKFITYAGRAQSRTEAEQFIREIRLEHPQARHVCWAYIAGSPVTTVLSMSDDGEPSGTAGRPMLNILQHSGLGEIVVAVVRYFGGIKLGTGGLQRAYSDAVSGVLQDLPLALKIARVRLTVTYSYGWENAIRHLVSSYDVVNVNYDYQQQVTMTLEVDAQQVDTLVQQLVNVTAGEAKLARED